MLKYVQKFASIKKRLTFVLSLIHMQYTNANISIHKKLF